MEEKLAIIREPKLGVTDRGTVALHFSTYISEGSAADQYLWLEGPDAKLEDALELLGLVSDVSQLDGRSVWVEYGNGMMIYLRPARI